MKVADLMTRDVVTVEPDTSVKAIAETLAARRISGLPVCEADGTVIGVVSEGDLLVRSQERPEERGGLLGWLLDAPSAEEVAKAGALTAREAMSTPPITIDAQRPAAAAAHEMIERGVNRLVVVDRNGRLAGIVTRADLVRAFARSDTEIEREIRDDVLRRTIWADPGSVEVSVHDGEVELHGELESKSEVELLGTFVTRVPGVVSVRSDVGYRFDDDGRRRRRTEH
jgi:CBS domain-containing protein